jgi:hypothetical protein
MSQQPIPAAESSNFHRPGCKVSEVHLKDPVEGSATAITQVKKCSPVGNHHQILAERRSTDFVRNPAR